MDEGLRYFLHNSVQFVRAMVARRSLIQDAQGENDDVAFSALPPAS